MDAKVIRTWYDVQSDQVRPRSQSTLQGFRASASASTQVDSDQSQVSGRIGGQIMKPAAYLNPLLHAPPNTQSSYFHGLGPFASANRSQDEYWCSVERCRLVGCLLSPNRTEPNQPTNIIEANISDVALGSWASCRLMTIKHEELNGHFRCTLRVSVSVARICSLLVYVYQVKSSRERNPK